MVQSRLTLPISEPLEGPDADRLPQLAQFIDGWSAVDGDGRRSVRRAVLL